MGPGRGSDVSQIQQRNTYRVVAWARPVIRFVDVHRTKPLTRSDINLAFMDVHTSGIQA